MATAQLTGRIKLDLRREWEMGKSGSFPRAHRSRAGVAKRRCTRGLLSGIVEAVTVKMQRSDTLADRAAGYGLCGISFFYLAAQVMRVVF
ncbi:MAG: hypothetical protein ACOY30_05365 [Bacillota bacterium]